MANQTSIEVSAKGEFSQLTRGLRDVKGALSDVTSIVDKGAKNGGIFNEKEVRALDIFANRFKTAMGSMDKLLDDQAKKLEQLYSQRRRANSLDIQSIDKEIKKHGDYLDALERERKELSELMTLRQRESQGFMRPGGPIPMPGGGTRGGGGSAGNGAIQVNIAGLSSTALSQIAQLLNRVEANADGPINQTRIQRYRDKQIQSDNGPSYNEDGTSSPSTPSSGTGAALGALGRGLKGLAGIAGISFGISQLMKWEQMAEQRDTSWSGLTQRTGIGRAAFEGAGAAYGYNTLQTQQALDIYSQEAGRPSLGALRTMGAFSRGYGVDINTTAAMAGQFAQLGYGAPGVALSNVAGSAASSGMVPRMIEVMQEQLGFLRSMDKSLKDNSGNSLMAYTTRLNQIGTAAGAAKLTGISGGSLLEQMGSNIFSPGNTTWQAMGMTLLSKYGGKSVQGLDAFGRMEQWQKGFQDPENMRVFGSYLSDATKGMNPRQAMEFKTLTLQNAMGGDTTLQQAQQFGELTNWLQSFNPSDPQMKKLLKGGNVAGNTKGVGASSGIGSKAAQWNATIAAKIEVTNAKWFNAQANAGEVLIPAKLQIEQIATNGLNSATGGVNNLTGGHGLNLAEILGIGAGAYLLSKGLRGVRGRGRGGRGGGPLGPDESPTRGGRGSVAAGAAEEGAVESESGLYYAIRRGGGSLLKNVGRSRIGRNLVGGAILAHMLMNEANPLYKSTIGKGVHLAGGIGHSLIRAGANVTAATPSMAWKMMKLFGNVPIVAGGIDTAYNHYALGDSWGKAATGGAVGTVGDMTGRMVGARIGGAIGSIGGEPGAAIGAGIGRFIGGTAGNIGGNWAGRNLFDFFTKGSNQGDYLKHLSTQGTLSLSKLSTNGARELSTLSKEGLVTINGEKNLTVAQIQDLNKKGQLEITNLNNKGAKALADLQRKGEVSLSAFSRNAVSVITSASNKQELDVRSLNTEGQKALGKLQQEGLIKIGSLQKDGTHEITVLNKDGAKALADLQAKGEVKLTSMDKTTSKKLSEITTTHEKLAKDMKKATDTGWQNLQTSFGNTLTSWWNDLKNFFHLGNGNDHTGSNDPAGTAAQKAIKSELSKKGYGQYWNITKALLNKETGGGKNEYGGTDPNDGQTPSGYFQFKDPTWWRYSQRNGSAIDYSAQTQTDAFIKYVIGRYGSFNNLANRTGLFNGTYKGYANGTYVAKDQTANIHAGEEIIGRSKTQEVLRKTGKLPSQVLSAAMQLAGTGAGSASTSSGARDLNVNVRLTADQNMSHVPAHQLIEMIKQVIQTQVFQEQSQHAFF